MLNKVESECNRKFTNPTLHQTKRCSVYICNNAPYCSTIPCSRVMLSFPSKYSPICVYQSLYFPTNRVKHDQDILYLRESSVMQGIKLMSTLHRCPIISNREFMEYQFTIAKENTIYVLFSTAQQTEKKHQSTSVYAETYIHCSKIYTDGNTTNLIMCSCMDLKLYSWQYKFANRYIFKKAQRLYQSMLQYMREYYDQLS